MPRGVRRTGLAAAALLVTCRGGGSEFRLKRLPFRIRLSRWHPSRNLPRAPAGTEKRRRNTNSQEERIIRIHSISLSPRRLISNNQSKKHHDRDTKPVWQSLILCGMPGHRLGTLAKQRPPAQPPSRRHRALHRGRRPEFNEIVRPRAERALSRRRSISRPLCWSGDGLVSCSLRPRRGRVLRTK